MRRTLEDVASGDASAGFSQRLDHVSLTLRRCQHAGCRRRDHVRLDERLQQLGNGASAENQVRQPDGLRRQQSHPDAGTPGGVGDARAPVQDDHRHAQERRLERRRARRENHEIGRSHRVMARAVENRHEAADAARRDRPLDDRAVLLLGNGQHKAHVRIARAQSTCRPDERRK